MSVGVDIHPESDYLHSALVGDFTVDGVNDGVASIVEAADQHQLLNVLLDCLHLSGDPSLKERFDLVSYALQLRVKRLLQGRRPRLRIAVVAVPPLMHPNHYIVRFLAERNMNITIVEDVESALAWLRAPANPVE